MIGETIAHYKILEKLGEGGMGVVYKAEDTKLKRIVALKFLAPELTRDATAKKRFIQEAQAASKLDHPNICTIYEINETEDGQLYIAMAYYKGETLKEKTDEGPFRIDETLTIAIYIAEGLQEAHEHGITHRDIKPSNIMITDKGQTKILDFGLAKSATGSIVTKAGTTLGTIAIMSPEQARGEKVDKRTDIWSLGVVIYNMLTGQMPFKGEYEQAIVYSIMNVDPEPITGVRTGVPIELEKIINKCLEKDKSDRYPTAEGLLVDINRLKRDTSKIIIGERAEGDEAVKPRKATGLAQRGNVIPKKWVIIGISALILVAILLGYNILQQRDYIPRFFNPLQITTAVGLENYNSWSNDGGRLVYDSDQSGNWDIWVTQIGRGEPVNLTEDHPGVDRFPSWSPDGTQIAFWSDRNGGSYFVMSALGGKQPRELPISKAIFSSYGQTSAAHISGSGAPQWSPDGKELACIVTDSIGIYIIEIVDLQTDHSRKVRFTGKDWQFDLNWSPDGRFLAYVDAYDRSWDISQIWILRISDGKSFAVTDGMTNDWSPSWSSNGKYLYFVSNRGGSMDLWQQSIGKDGTPKGSPQPVTTAVGMRNAVFSPDGSKLAYSKGRRVDNIWSVPILEDRMATWEDAIQVTFDQAAIQHVNVSPDGKWLLFNSDRKGNYDIWKMPVEGGEMQQITTDPAPDWYPDCSPDGKKVVFYSYRSGNRDIWVKPVSGGPAQQLTTDKASDLWPDWSPDGRYITFTSLRNGNHDICVMSVEGGQVQRLTTNTASDNVSIWSPKGDWITFISNRTGYQCLWRMPPEGGNPELIIEELGTFPAWTPDWKKIYSNRGGNLWVISVEDGYERQLTDFKNKRGKMLSYISLSPDRKRIFFIWGEAIGDLWIMDVEWVKK